MIKWTNIQDNLPQPDEKDKNGNYKLYVIIRYYPEGNQYIICEKLCYYGKISTRSKKEKIGFYLTNDDVPWDHEITNVHSWSIVNMPK